MINHLSKYRFDGKEKLKLSNQKTDYIGNYHSKEDAQIHLTENIERMIEEQAKLFAQDRYALLIIFQAMDTAGKDGAIRHVMSGLNPQGTQVFNFKQPSNEDLDHDYLWRINKCLPDRGRIGIFNRSYYEEVLVVRVHDLIKTQKLPKEAFEHIWENRFEQINNYEKYLFQNGIIPIKIFLHMSKEEQEKRLLSRIDDQSKNWKFSEADIKERQYWDDYQKCYEDAINETGTEYAPWYVIPADKKWYARLIISQIIVKTLNDLKLSYPEISEEQELILQKYKKLLVEDEV